MAWPKYSKFYTNRSDFEENLYLWGYVQNLEDNDKNLGDYVKKLRDFDQSPRDLFQNFWAFFT